MNARRTPLLLASAALAGALVAVGSPPASSLPGAAGSKPEHLVWAERLVEEVAPDRNVYGSHPTFVIWSEDGDGAARNRSVCSSFVSHVLERAYGFGDAQLVLRFGLAVPQARDYYAAVVAERGFARVRALRDLLPGDIIAVRYPPGSKPTGHVMIVDGPPRPHPATAPLIDGTTQYEIAVIDSSHSFHGLKDTRYEAAGKEGQGVGRGTLRLYENAAGEIAGYAWSTRAISKFYPQSEHELAVGRFQATLPASASPIVSPSASEDDDTADPGD